MALIPSLQVMRACGEEELTLQQDLLIHIIMHLK